MSTEIYYFSGTGNSLVIARDIAEKNNGKLISIPSVMDEESIRTDAEVIGIVFPVYHASFGESGIPFIVGRFISKLENISSKYLFAICTHMGAPGKTIENLGKMTQSRGGRLAAGFTVKMNFSYSAVEKIKYSLFHKELKTDILTENKKRQKLIDNWKKKLEAIYKYINARKEGELETQGIVEKFILALLLPIFKKGALSRYRKLSNSSLHSFDELIPLADRSFCLDKKCNGCGICARVCPVRNIKMVDKNPVWQHHCENCYACFQWCPQEAIHGEIVEYEKRYHHLDVKLSDMMICDEK